MATTAKRRAVGYTRVSTAAQATEEKVSLDEQHSDIEAYCESKDYELVEVYTDAGYSGASKRRPAFQRMLKDAQAGAFDVIVAWKSDRLSRGLYAAAALMEVVEGSQLGLEAVKDTIDLNTFGLLAAVGKIELESIRERARMSARGRAKRGQLWGDVRFGYRLGADNAPEVEPAEAEIVRRVFTEYVAGQRPGVVADYLNADHLLTRRGNLWDSREIWRMIRDPIYKGEGHYNRRSFFKRDNGEREVTHRRFNPEDEWIPVAFPVVVEPELWDRAQVLRKQSARLNAPTGANLKFLLHGLVRCGDCGGRFVGNGRSGYNKRYRRKDGSLYEKRVNSPARSYRCLSTAKRQTACAKRSISALQLEGLVWRTVTELLSDPAAIHDLMEARRQEFEATGTNSELDKARRHLESADTERGRRLGQHAKGYISDGELDLALRNLQERLEMYGEDVQRLEREAAAFRRDTGVLEDFIATADRLHSRLSTMDDDERSDVLRLLVNRVVVGPNEVQIVLVLDVVLQTSDLAS